MTKRAKVEWHFAKGAWNTTILQKWFDGIEESLTREASMAGLLQHGSLVGSVREFLVKRVLQSVLPPAAHIGMGRVIDAFGKMSRQMDIVIYDSRLPVFELNAGIGLYPIEGVLATIEVKSNLTKGELRKALENCNSVLTLTMGITEAKYLNERTEAFIDKGLDLTDAAHRADFEHKPATYVFALCGMQQKTLASQLDKWFVENNGPASPSPHLPRVVVCDKTVALLQDGYMQIIPTEELIQKAEPTQRVLMAICKTTRRFGWLALHLLNTVSSRLGATNAKLSQPRLVDHYLGTTGRVYYEEDLKENEIYHILWAPPDPSAL